MLIRGCLQSLGALHDLAIRQAEVESAHAAVGMMVYGAPPSWPKANKELRRQAEERRRAELNDRRLAAIVEAGGRRDHQQATGRADHLVGNPGAERMSRLHAGRDDREVDRDADRGGPTATTCRGYSERLRAGLGLDHCESVRLAEDGRAGSMCPQTISPIGTRPAGSSARRRSRRGCHRAEAGRAGLVPGQRLVGASRARGERPISSGPIPPSMPRSPTAGPPSRPCARARRDSARSPKRCRRSSG